MTQQTTGSPAMNGMDDDQRKGVRRTVTVLVSVVLFFFVLSFVQILLMK